MGCCPTCGQGLAANELLIDLGVNRVAYDGAVAELQPAEAELLVTLFRHAPGLATKEVIAVALWGVLSPDRSRHCIPVHVYGLRKKLAPLGIRIETHWGRGYSLQCPAGALKDAKRQVARRRAA